MGTYGLQFSDGTSYYNFTDWQALSGSPDANSIYESDPLVFDASSNKYWLSPDSPAIGAGQNLSNISDDFLNPATLLMNSIKLLNQNYYGPSWEIGAYVYVGPPNVTITSPTATTYTSSGISFEASTSENSTCNYTVDAGVTNHSMTANASGTGFTASQTLSNGDYTCTFYCEGNFKNINNSESVTFTVNVVSSSSSSSSGGGVPTYTVSVEQFAEGYIKSVGRGWKLKFNVENETHSLKVDDLTESTVKIIVSSEPQEATLVVGDRKSTRLNSSHTDISRMPSSA